MSQPEPKVQAMMSIDSTLREVLMMMAKNRLDHAVMHLDGGMAGIVEFHIEVFLDPQKGKQHTALLKELYQKNPLKTN